MDKDEMRRFFMSPIYDAFARRWQKESKEANYIKTRNTLITIELMLRELLEEGDL